MTRHAVVKGRINNNFKKNNKITIKTKIKTKTWVHHEREKDREREIERELQRPRHTFSRHSLRQEEPKQWCRDWNGIGQQPPLAALPWSNVMRVVCIVCIVYGVLCCVLNVVCIVYCVLCIVQVCEGAVDDNIGKNGRKTCTNTEWQREPVNSNRSSLSRSSVSVTLSASVVSVSFAALLLLLSNVCTSSTSSSYTAGWTHSHNVDCTHNTTTTLKKTIINNNNQQQSTTINNNQQQSTTINNNQQQQSTHNNNQQQINMQTSWFVSFECTGRQRNETGPMSLWGKRFGWNNSVWPWRVPERYLRESPQRDDRTNQSNIKS